MDVALEKTKDKKTKKKKVRIALFHLTPDPHFKMRRVEYEEFEMFPGCGALTGLANKVTGYALLNVNF